MLPTVVGQFGKTRSADSGPTQRIVDADGRIDDRVGITAMPHLALKARRIVSRRQIQRLSDSEDRQPVALLWR